MAQQQPTNQQPTTNKPILVTGVGGKVGGVSTIVMEHMLKKGYKVRALVHRETEDTQSYRDQGAEVIVGDLLKLADAHRAINGVGRIYYSMPVSDSYLEASLNVIAVAKHYGVEVLVNMSQLPTAAMDITHSAKSPQSRAHWLAEQALDWSGIPWVNIQPTLFLEIPYLSLWLKEALLTKNILHLPFGRATIHPMAAYDVARVIVAILDNPTPHIGKHYPLVGAKELNMDEVAEEYSKGLGRTVKYVPETDEHRDAVWAKLVEQGIVSKHTVAHLVWLSDIIQGKAQEYNEIENLWFTHNDNVEKLTGVAPQTIAEWVRQNKEKYFV